VQNTKDKIKKALSSPTAVASKAALSKALTSVTGAKKPTKKLTFRGILKGAKDTLLAAAPDLLGLVPGVGPALKMVATSLNDDEWYGAYTAAGATFNEYIQSSKFGSSKTTALIPAVARIECRINSDAQNETEEFAANYMPSVLAYIRGKTNNVLADDTDSYSKAFYYASELYATYYTGCKYVKLAQHLPTNIPVLSATLAPLNPVHISAFRGVIEALGDYLKSTVRIPYAWTEYLRWRFGTTFHSDNTGKPGLILYDYATYFGVDSTPDSLEAAITTLRQAIAQTGRAAADFMVAYGDHQIRYDVEDAHFDAKEYNLRANSAPMKLADEIPLYMDSRLDPTAGIQAVTMSTESSWAPIKITARFIHTYMKDKTPQMGGDLNTVDAPAGWYVVKWKPEVIGSSTGYDQDAKLMVAFQGEWPTAGCYLKSTSTTAVPLTDATNPRNWFVKGPIPLTTDPLSDGQETAMLRMGYILYLLAGDALQLHGWIHTFAIGKARYATSFLSYDMAVISPSQLTAIQRTAMRNLTRGDYKAKTPVTQKPDVKDAVQELEEAAVQDMTERV